MASTTTGEKLTCGVHHVGLAVKDLDKSFEFFKVLGYDKVGGDPNYPSYFISDAHTMITLWQTDAGRPTTEFNRRTNVGLHHLAIKVPSEEALKKAYDAVTALDGVKSDSPPQELYGMPIIHAMVFEPSGNRIEFTYVRQVTYGS